MSEKMAITRSIARTTDDDIPRRRGRPKKKTFDEQLSPQDAQFLAQLEQGIKNIFPTRKKQKEANEAKKRYFKYWVDGGRKESVDETLHGLRNYVNDFDANSLSKEEQNKLKRDFKIKLFELSRDFLNPPDEKTQEKLEEAIKAEYIRWKEHGMSWPASISWKHVRENFERSKDFLEYEDMVVLRAYDNAKEVIIEKWGKSVWDRASHLFNKYEEASDFTSIASINYFNKTMTNYTRYVIKKDKMYKRLIDYARERGLPKKELDEISKSETKGEKAPDYFDDMNGKMKALETKMMTRIDEVTPEPQSEDEVQYEQGEDSDGQKYESVSVKAVKDAHKPSEDPPTKKRKRGGGATDLDKYFNKLEAAGGDINVMKETNFKSKKLKIDDKKARALAKIKNVSNMNKILIPSERKGKLKKMARGGIRSLASQNKKLAKQHEYSQRMIAKHGFKKATEVMRKRRASAKKAAATRKERKGWGDNQWSEYRERQTMAQADKESRRRERADRKARREVMSELPGMGSTRYRAPRVKKTDEELKEIRLNNLEKARDKRKANLDAKGTKDERKAASRQRANERARVKRAANKTPKQPGAPRLNAQQIRELTKFAADTEQYGRGIAAAKRARRSAGRQKQSLYNRAKKRGLNKVQVSDDYNLVMI